MTPETMIETLAAARADLAQGRLAAAEQGFAAVLRVDPGHPGALSGQAGVLFQQRQDDAALATLARALVREPNNPVLLRERGDMLLELRQPEAALASYDAALAVNYHTRGAMDGAGMALLRLGQPKAALARFDVVVQRGPDWAPGLYQRALALQALGRLEAAVAGFDRVLAFSPLDGAVLRDRGNALQSLMRDQAAVESYSQALATLGNDAITLNNRGVSLWRLERRGEAAADFQAAVTLMPMLAPAQSNMGMLSEEIGATTDALGYFRQALAIDPNERVALLGSVTACLPPVRTEDDDLDAIRATHQAAVDTLFAWADDPERACAVTGAVAPFNLAYHDRDNRDALAHHGAHCVAAMERWRAHAGFERTASMPWEKGAGGAGRRIRLGIVSSQFWTHSVWLAIVRGWIQHMDRGRFEIHLFHTGTRLDQQTDWARQNVAAFTHGLGDAPAWAHAITAWQPDILIYPDIGMEPLPMRLASLRLADAQMVSWGHPETTGLSTIDYFISAAALEPPGAQAFYTEKLITLPRLGCCYGALPVVPQAPDLARLGVRGDVPILLCPGTPFKYAPEHDRVLARIAKRIGPCQILFFAYLRSPALSHRLMARLEQAFVAEGVDFAAHVVLVPWHLTPWFYGLMHRADVFLDTIGFSGFNTAIQAIECGLPVVTVEGNFMRGRLASGILREMEMDELVAADTAAYEDIAVRLAQDAAYRQDVRTRLLERRTRLFDDVETVRALERFLESVMG